MDERRLDYPLGKDSVVFDVGMYQGEFSRWCLDRWGCLVYAFEPVAAFRGNPPHLKDLPLEKRARLCVCSYGLGATNRWRTISIKNDSTTLYFDPATAVETTAVEVRSITDAMTDLEVGNIDLLKLNCEGSEYEILDHLIDTGAILRCRYLQIQFHPNGAYCDATKHRATLRAKLAGTHREQWCVDECWPTWTWESWEIRP